MGYCFENPGQFVAFCLVDSCRQILWITYEYSSVIRQKGEFQSRCYQKAKDAKFRKNEHFLPSDTFLDSPFCLMTDVLYFSFQVLSHDDKNVKAYYRRAQAKMKMQDLEEAKVNLMFPFFFSRTSRTLIQHETSLTRRVESIAIIRR